MRLYSFRGLLDGSGGPAEFMGNVDTLTFDPDFLDYHDVESEEDYELPPPPKPVKLRAGKALLAK